MLAVIPILRSLLAYPHSLLTDYCSLSLLAADFSLLAGLYSLHAAHCHTYAKSAKKRVGQLVNSKFLKIRKQKSRPNVGNEKKKVSFNKKSLSFYEKKKSAVCRQISKNQRKWFARKQVGHKSAITTWATSAYVYSLHF